MPSKELFQALEWAHYAERFRDKVFVIGLPETASFTLLLPDIKVLTGYRIQVVLAAPDPQGTLEGLVARSNTRGTRFQWIPPEHPLHPGELKAILAQGRTPLLTSREAGQEYPSPAHRLAGKAAQALEAHKLFLLLPDTSPWQKALGRSHVTAEELAAWRKSPPPPEVSTELLNFIERQLAQGVSDLVLLDGEPTQLFREVFTYDGAGVLFNRTRQPHIRQARVEDITNLMLLIRPGVEEGRILPVEENEVEEHIHQYWVYDIEGDLVGVARLKPQGDQAELAQFTTLSRYRGRGRAKELAQRLIDQARGQGYQAVFALSVDPRMWAFFQGLGFQEVPRETLPTSWKKGYDFLRPSKAFRLHFKP
ncbi:MAG: GNAT family N-acetyltransferase [Deltaproteobacteria bacterium]|nr:GNAT family N-acetyltransferase [Deltaproteobacteria bacterium]